MLNYEGKSRKQYFRKEELEKRLLLQGDLPADLSLSLDRKAVHC
jgi:hypothetical protein